MNNRWPHECGLPENMRSVQEALYWRIRWSDGCVSHKEFLSKRYLVHFWNEEISEHQFQLWLYLIDYWSLAQMRHLKRKFPRRYESAHKPWLDVKCVKPAELPHAWQWTAPSHSWWVHWRCPSSSSVQGYQLCLALDPAAPSGAPKGKKRARERKSISR